MPTACSLLGLIAGGLLTVFLTNRWVFNFRETPARTFVHLLIALGLTLGPAMVGYTTGSLYVLVPSTGVIALFAVGELRRVARRRRLVAQGPVESQPAARRSPWRPPVTTTQLTVARYELAVPGLSVPRLRIAHASDLHVSAQLPADYFKRVRETIAASQADLLLLTGDFISHTRDLPRLRDFLNEASTLARLGAFAILGNHDHWTDAEAVAEVLRESGVTRLGERVVYLTPAPGCTPIRLCGDERPWGPASDWQPEEGVTVVLSHTPDNIFRIATQRPQLVLSGHNHAGQIRLPLIGPMIVPSRYGRLFDHGHFLVESTHLFVTAGVGTGIPALRIGCPPDFFVIDLLAAAVLPHP